MLTGSKVDDAPATGIYAFIYNEVLDGWETCNLAHRLEVGIRLTRSICDGVITSYCRWMISRFSSRILQTCTRQSAAN